jgi:thioredoxin-dependent peroxiredoxin
MHDRRRVVLATLALTVSLALAGSVGAQQPGQITVGPAVGETAPDFTFQGITRYGILRDRVKLSDFRGQAVVLAFFPKARTKG